MKILIVSQKISDQHLTIIKSALPKESKIEIVTGSNLNLFDYIKAPPHNPKSIRSRLKCWRDFYRFVKKKIIKDKSRQYDIIFSTSNPPINGLLGIKLKKRFKAKFIYMNWDLYPQVIEQSMNGVLPKILSFFWNKLNNRIYPKVDQMVTIGKVMSNTINYSLRKKIQIDIIPMFTDTKIMRPIKKNENIFSINNKLVDKFVVLFSGKMGLGHNLEILLESSKYLREYSEIQFLFIGYGQKYDMISEWIDNEKAENVRIMTLQSNEMFPFSMATGDIGFITQEKKSSKCFMPAKTYDMMASGLAIISYSEGNDDLSNLVNQYELGISVTENSPLKLANYIKSLYLDKEKTSFYKENSRNVAVKKFDISKVTKKYQKTFNKVITSNSEKR